MRLKTAFLVASLLLTGLAGIASAQTRATLLLKSGERIQADLIDLNASGYVVTVDGQERRVRPDDIAVIDFTGDAQNFPANETQKLTPGQNLLVMRDGQIVAGKMNDVGGTQPKLIYFSYPGGPENVTSDRVARIYLSTPPASATTGTAGSGTQTSTDPAAIHVSAKTPWTSSGVSVQKGQALRFSSSGQVQLSKDPNDVAPVQGKGGTPANAKAPLPGTLNGALIGRVGNGRPFGIGDQATLTAPATGLLYLGVNDDVFTDNSGEFLVSVSGGVPASAIRR